MISTLIISLIALATGVLLRFWIKKRRFNRRKPNQGFRTYEQYLVIRNLERIGKLVAYALILYGIVGYFVYKSEKKKLEHPRVENRK